MLLRTMHTSVRPNQTVSNCTSALMGKKLAEDTYASFVYSATPASATFLILLVQAIMNCNCIYDVLFLYYNNALRVVYYNNAFSTIYHVIYCTITMHIMYL